jgi:hypothetical protein
MKTLLRTGLVLCTLGALSLTTGCKHRSYDNRGNLNEGNAEAARKVPAEEPTQGTVYPQQPAVAKQQGWQPQTGAVGGGPRSPVNNAQQAPIQPGSANTMQGGASGGPGGYSQSGD